MSILSFKTLISLGISCNTLSPNFSENKNVPSLTICPIRHFKRKKYKLVYRSSKVSDTLK